TGMVSVAQAFDNPARVSWLSFLVPRQLVSGAIGMMALTGNSTLMIGPSVAGVLIATIGVNASFFVQAGIQWFVVLAVVLMRPSPHTEASREPMLQQIFSGILFVAGHPVLRWSVLLLMVISVLVRPYAWLLATYAAHVVHVDAKAYGVMLTMGGIGTIFG